MRKAAGTSVAGALDVNVPSAYTELSIHLVPAPSTTPAGSAFAVVYTSLMRMTSLPRAVFMVANKIPRLVGSFCSFLGAS